ncbi:hypothetical protein PtA15_4A571 [Puccinia triticina]|uniref:Histone chaperone domain-containing protein n=1 Tax=Puccinia triticina TaxID=208348 RepID=A0ABY7CH89_9BASI|nr:uncharacterized protein PtA15_4A571 [Puccinia triticina]WAQ84120.1 hypothetical protein PtA15_4A571 [Puccinia triticina]
MARTSASPHHTPSRPASRHSTRIITPIRSNSNYVRSNVKSRKSILVPPTPTQNASRDCNIQIDSQDPDIQIDPAGQSQTQSTQSRQSQLQPSKKTSTKQKQKPPTKRKRSKKTVNSNEESDSDESGDNPIDHVQDSDAENSKAQYQEIDSI